jgi:hypothetical protein
MWEIHKSGSVRGIEVSSAWFEYCDTPQTERVEKLGIQNKPKCRRPYYVYSTQNVRESPCGYGKMRKSPEYAAGFGSPSGDRSSNDACLNY